MISTERFERFALIVALIICGIFVITLIIGVIMYELKKRNRDMYMEFDEGIEEDDFIITGKRRRSRQVTLKSNRVVRAMFKRKVNEHRRKGLLIKTSDTAQIISEDINPAEDITQLNGLYHIARYSGDVITSADISALKNRKGK